MGVRLGNGQIKWKLPFRVKGLGLGCRVQGV